MTENILGNLQKMYLTKSWGSSETDGTLHSLITANVPVEIWFKTCTYSRAFWRIYSLYSLVWVLGVMPVWMRQMFGGKYPAVWMCVKIVMFIFSWHRLTRAAKKNLMFAQIPVHIVFIVSNISLDHIIQKLNYLSFISSLSVIERNNIDLHLDIGFGFDQCWNGMSVTS